MGSNSKKAFEELNRRLLSNSLSILYEWFPNGKKKGKEFTTGNIYGDKGKSLSVNINTGEWADFADTIKGGDLISLYARKEKISNSEALEILTNQYHNLPKASLKKEEDFKPYFPPKELKEISHPLKGKPSFIWPIYHHNGKLLFYNCRFDEEGKRKSFMSYSYGEFKGIKGWHWKTPPKNRPLYRIEKLKNNPDAIIVICEGCKTADAAQNLLGDESKYLAIAWTSGANGIDKDDFTPLFNRQIIIWPDADEPGRKAAEKIKEILTDARIIKTDNDPDKWDAADYLENGMTPQECIRKISEKRRIYKFDIDENIPTLKSIVGDNLIIENSLFFLIAAPKAGKTDLLLEWVIHLCLGKPFLNFDTSRKLKVMFFQAEMHRGNLRDRTLHLKLNEEEKKILKEHLYYTDKYIYGFDQEMDDLIESIKEEKFIPDIIIFDPFRDNTTERKGNLDENSSSDMRRAINHLKEISYKINPNATIIISHHTSKVNYKTLNEDPFNAFRGSSALRGMYDSAAVLAKPSIDANFNKLYFELRYGKPIEPLNIFKTEDGWSLIPHSTKRLYGERQGMLADAERARKYDIILSLIAQNAMERGELYTIEAFIAQFEGDKYNLGSSKTIKDLINNLAKKGIIKYFKANYNNIILPQKSFGYLVIKNMQLLNIDKKGYRRLNKIEPTHERQINTGDWKLVDQQNLNWEYQNESNS